MTELRVETCTLPGGPIGPENPLPFFRDRATDRVVPVRDSMPEAKREHLGWQAGRRVLPYRMQDHYSRQREEYSMRVLVLENEILRATFWVELGGRLMSLVHKPLERELLYNNPVFQPANLALRNAWFAGGVEWNVGQYGHSFLTCSPVFAAAITGEHSEPGLRLYEFERCKGLLWHTDFYLPPGAEFLTAFTRVVNPQDQDTSMYWWTNIAVPEAPGVRVLAPADEAIYLDRALDGFGYARLPDLPSLPGQDPTYALNWPNANEFFFQCDQADLPWEAALDQTGQGLIEVSTPRLKYRKLFCWGTHAGGRHWQEFLAVPGRAYLEIQAGLAPTQLHHRPMAARAEWCWTEFFGLMQADPARVHAADYHAAWQAVDAALKRRLSPDAAERIEADCRVRADAPFTVLLNEGSGWGALEMARLERTSEPRHVPATFFFPARTLGPEQSRWLPVLEGRALPEQSADAVPGEYLTQAPWRERLARSLGTPTHRNWFALLHYGVMLAEAFDHAGAEAAWQESIRRQPSAWAYRNLAALRRANDNLAEALDLYAQAWQLALHHRLPLEPFAHEYLSILIQSGGYQAAWDLIAGLPAEAADSDRVQILRAMAALELGQWDVVEQILGREFATVREGQVDLTNVWFAMWRRRIAQAAGRRVEDVSWAEVVAAHPAPRAIDFRSAE